MRENVWDCFVANVLCFNVGVALAGLWYHEPLNVVVNGGVAIRAALILWSRRSPTRCRAPAPLAALRARGADQ